MAEPTVGAGFARGLFRLALAKGAPRAALLGASGIDPAALEDQDARIPFSQYVALMRAAKAMSGDQALGLHYGETVDISEVSVVGLIGQASATMLEAFHQLARYVSLIVETENEAGSARFRLDRDREGLWVIDARRNPNAFPELSESAFAQIACSPRRGGAPRFVAAVQFTHEAPSYRDEYERIFEAPVQFAAARNAMRIDEAWVNRPLQRLPRYAFGVMSEHADGLMSALEGTKTVRGRVEAALMPILHNGEAGMAKVASQMGMSRQTLFRRLKAEGVTFEEVLDDLRQAMALDYLRARKASVSEVAYLVGFSDPAAFSRAFKRWTGASPSAARQAAVGD